MKLLYFDQYFPPEKASGLHLVQDLLDGMAERGWDVEVCVPTPTRGVDEETRQLFKREKRVEVTRGGRVIVKRMSLMREDSNPVSRALRFAIFSIKCFCKALGARYDVIFTGSGPPTQGFILGLASRIRHKPLVYNLQDIFPDSLVTTGLTSEGSLLWLIGRRIEDSSYRSAARIITVSERMRANVIGKGAEIAKLSVVMNWEDLESVNEVPKAENRLYGELGIDSARFTVLYAGNLGASQDLMSLIELAEDARDLNVQFVIVGSGSEEVRLKAAAKMRDLDNVHFRPLQPLERVSEVYSMADVAYVSCAKGVGSAGFPSKCWSIFATSRPVLASFDVESDLGDAIRDFGLGYVSEPADRSGRYENLLALMSDTPARRAMGRAARCYVEKNGEKIKSVERYLDIIDSTVLKGSNHGECK